MKSFGAPLLALLLSGCSTFAHEAVLVPTNTYAANYRAADNLAASAGSQLDLDRPILVATVVDIDDLERSSTLGRFLSESISTRFTQNRYRMVEMKLQNSVYMKAAQGELMLTRQIREIALSHQAQAVIVGTYSLGSSAVFINIKIVRPESNIVIGAQDYSLPISMDICMMIHRDEKRCADRR